VLHRVEVCISRVYEALRADSGQPEDFIYSYSRTLEQGQIKMDPIAALMIARIVS
jgi:hypothetical protein